MTSQYPVRPLSDLAERIDYGLTASADQSAVGPKFLRITDVAAERLDWSTVPFCHVTSQEVRRRFTLEVGDIVIARTGATVGYSKLIREKVGAVFASYLVRVRVRSDSDSAYVGYVVGSEDYRAFIRANAGGAAQPNANARVLTSYPVPVPPLPTQRKIAAVLSAYDDIIETNNRRIELLEEMARRIYHEWFIDFRYPGHERVSLVDLELGSLPEGWEWKELRDVAVESRVGLDPESIDPTTPYIGLEHMPKHSIAISEWGLASQAGSMKYTFKVGDILFGKIRPYFHKVVVPPVAGVCSTDAIVIRSRAPSLASLVLAVVSSDAFVEKAVQTSQGTKMPRANWGVLERYPVAFATASLMQHFCSFMDHVVAEIHKLVKSNRNLRATRDLLLPRLISGEIDVADLNIAMSEAAG